MIKESKLKNKSRKIVKKYGKNNNKNLRHKKTVKNIKNFVGIKSQRGGEVQDLANFDYEQLSISKYINTQVNWGSCPGQVPTPNCSIL